MHILPLRKFKGKLSYIATQTELFLWLYLFTWNLCIICNVVTFKLITLTEFISLTLRCYKIIFFAMKKSIVLTSKRTFKRKLEARIEEIREAENIVISNCRVHTDGRSNCTSHVSEIFMTFC